MVSSIKIYINYKLKNFVLRATAPLVLFTIIFTAYTVYMADYHKKYEFTYLDVIITISIYLVCFAHIFYNIAITMFSYIGYKNYVYDFFAFNNKGLFFIEVEKNNKFNIRKVHEWVFSKKLKNFSELKEIECKVHKFIKTDITENTGKSIKFIGKTQYINCDGIIIYNENKYKIDKRFNDFEEIKKIISTL